MKQLGNLALICAQRRSILFMVESESPSARPREAPATTCAGMMIRRFRMLSTN